MSSYLVRNDSDTNEMLFSIIEKKYCPLVSKSSQTFWLEVMDSGTTQRLGLPSWMRPSDHTGPGTVMRDGIMRTQCPLFSPALDEHDSKSCWPQWLQGEPNSSGEGHLSLAFLTCLDCLGVTLHASVAYYQNWFYSGVQPSGAGFALGPKRCISVSTNQPC